MSLDSSPDLDKILYRSMNMDSSPDFDKISTYDPHFYICLAWLMSHESGLTRQQEPASALESGKVFRF